MSRTPTRIALAAALLVGLLAGCKSATPIKTLLDDPGRFDKQVVRVSGTVSHAVGAIGYGAFQLNDGSGTITVVTKTEGAPRDGAQVGVEGEFRSAFTVGTESVAVILEHQRYSP